MPVTPEVTSRCGDERFEHEVQQRAVPGAGVRIGICRFAAQFDPSTAHEARVDPRLTAAYELEISRRLVATKNLKLIFLSADVEL
jgi:hypothetical protein